VITFKCAGFRHVNKDEAPNSRRKDAYPTDTFSGRISQIRLDAQNVQNVVTYNAVIEVDNSALKLKPGMTANLTFTIAKRANVLRAPNAALRFTPSGVTPGGPGESFSSPTAAVLPGQSRIVWALGPDHRPQTRRITIGITDGVNTEVTEGDLKEGESVILGQT